MSTGQASKKVRLGEEVSGKDVKAADDEEELDISKDIKGLISAIGKFKNKAASDVKHKRETIITSLNNELKEAIEQAKMKGEKERQASIKAITKICKETEGAMKSEALKFQTLHEKFTNDMKVHTKMCEEIYNGFEEQKEKLVVKLDQQRKKDKSTLEELNKIASQKIAEAEGLLKKRKQEEKSINYLKQTLGSFFGDTGSGDELEE